jgi:hypothetical protein
VLGFSKSVFDFGAGTTRLLAAFIGLVATVVTISLASSGPTLPQGAHPVHPTPTAEPTAEPRTAAEALAAGCYMSDDGTEWTDCP